MPLILSGQERKRSGPWIVMAAVVLALVAVLFAPVRIPIPFAHCSYVSNPCAPGIGVGDMPYGFSTSQEWGADVYALRIPGWVWKLRRYGGITL